MKESPAPHPWLLLIHQIPHKPDYLRVKIRRRLQGVGAVATRSAVYVLPASDGALEDFQWIAKEIRAAGGEASICEANFVEGISDDEIRRLFGAARDAEYREVETSARVLLKSLPPKKTLDDATRSRAEQELKRLRRRLDETVRLDFFGGPGRMKAEEALTSIEVRIADKTSTPPPTDARRRTADLRGKVWVTRRHIHVDRIATAWLVRRFIDPKARFKFVDVKTLKSGAGEITFDMFEGDFTHEGDRCTFETVVHRLELGGEPLHALAQIIHDIDLKDCKFGRDETAGVAAMIEGLCRGCARDEDRIERGLVLMDDLHASFGGGRPPSQEKRKPRK